ncbi:MAG: Smr/MutS family protein, partial [Lachnospiraceae bacterium]|nr:Smr/MutS family protein [Lachnospiraceae bacterium]
RLLIGIPGKSNAFAISSKLGLSDDIIEEAREYIGSNDQSFEDVISGLEEKRLAMEAEKRQIDEYKAEIETLKKRLAEKYDRLDNAKERILREANEEARDILQKAKDYADETIKKFNKWGMSGNNREMELERSALREQLGEKDKKLAVRKKMNQNPAETKELQVGDTVMVLSFNLEGKVITLPNAKGDLTVQMGVMQTQVNKKDIQWIGREKKEEPDKKNTQSGKIKMSKAMTIRTDLNLIGMRVDEALPELDKYLDDAYLSHLSQVTIIHGRGTGALKDAVHAHLKRTKYVKSYRLGAFGEGDQGVTIVEFK